MAKKTNAQLEAENKELKEKIESLTEELNQAAIDLQEAVETKKEAEESGNDSIVAMLQKAAEKAESPRVRHLIQRAIAKV